MTDQTIDLTGCKDGTVHLSSCRAVRGFPGCDCPKPMTETNNPSGAADVLAFLEQEAKRFNPEHAETARQARTAAAALIARNAELEAESEAGKFRSTNRDVTLSDPRQLAERLPSYARQFGNETIFARTIAALLLEANTAVAERDALAAENKALREASAPHAMVVHDAGWAKSYPYFDCRPEQWAQHTEGMTDRGKQTLANMLAHHCLLAQRDDLGWILTRFDLINKGRPYWHVSNDGELTYDYDPAANAKRARASAAAGGDGNG